jgi:hypothetical protein
MFFVYEFMVVLSGNTAAHRLMEDFKNAPENEKRKMIKDNFTTVFWIFFVLYPINILYLIWILAGLFTNQTLLFFILLILGLLIKALPQTAITRRAYAAMSMIILFSIINSHFNH